jgi:hypothetical protein
MKIHFKRAHREKLVSTLNKLFLFVADVKSLWWHNVFVPYVTIPKVRNNPERLASG